MRVSILSAVLAFFATVSPDGARADDAGLDFFEKKVRPALVEHCYRCHSARAKKVRGGLRLDLKAGWQKGGDSGKPAIVPGKPDESPLIRAVRHADGVEAMPPNQSRLPDAVIADLVAWVKSGAPDPRGGEAAAVSGKEDWETAYRRRLDWWSLQPVVSPPVPQVKQTGWARNDVDRFILAALEAKGLQPAPEADRRTLARRLSFALTGLPPDPASVERFVADSSPDAYEKLVQALLASPHFGEHWARHWMDVVHYSDTHGYEWDVPAKNAWRYRDYLVRAFNGDVPVRQMVLEQIAGDLVAPRVDAASGVNESLIGPMALRLGERRHGDNADIEGITQEAVANIIDTVGKAFLGTTLACAQCHDHKFDAVAQRDYYALAGVFMSTRWGARSLAAADPNEAVLAELGRIKRSLRGELAKRWRTYQGQIVEKIKALPAKDKTATGFPETLAGFWRRSQQSPVTPEEFDKERSRRIAENRANLKLLADFTRPDGAAGWRWEGFGMKHGLVGDGEIVVADEGNRVLAQVLPAGRWSHVWSQRLAGAVSSPLFDPAVATTFSVGLAGGRRSALLTVVDHAFFPEGARTRYLDQPGLAWLTVTTGGFQTLEGSVDRARRRTYVEVATKSLNTNFPPRGGIYLPEDETPDERSWFGITQVYQHAPGKPPLDELTRFAPLFKEKADWATRLANLVLAAVERWGRGECNGDDARLLDDALRSGLLPNDCKADPQLAKLVAEYRAVEKKLQPEPTVGSAADWDEGRNERIGVRGSYTDFGDEVPRGAPRFLGSGAGFQPAKQRQAGSLPHASSPSGRLELARTIASEKNPLTARVYVNRVWHYLLGEGLVRTPDDFGHLGQRPSHPELLDYLAARFMQEGWSHKKLVTLLVTSATWRQSSLANPEAVAIDPENRFWHHLPLRRLEAEAIRDAMLAVSGRLDAHLYGPPIDPYRAATDPMKRLYRGPLDGNGRRSLYTKVTLMEPPRFLALFNQPIPKLTTGRRDVTNVPDQALALLNDPFVLAMARHWSERVLHDGAASPEQRARQMFATALGRPPRDEEAARLVHLAIRSAELRGAGGQPLLQCQAAWQDVAHAIFNVKEFIYLP
jgi:mono/diheme cytochrome c family protein